MASLANQTISSSYDGLIKTSSDNAVGVSGVQLLQDGSGNDLALSLGRTGQGASITGNLTVDTNTLFVDAANNRVGIGTSSPDNSALEISYAGNQIQINTTNEATYGRLDIGHFTNGTFIGTQAGSDASSDLLRFGTSGTERMRIDSSGNVGIGTSSPDEALHIFGNQRLVGNNIATANTLVSEINVFAGTSNQFKSSSIKFLTGAFVDEGRITFNTSIGGADVERARVDSDGLKFNGDTAAANALDDYEEGTWTPTANLAITIDEIINAFYTKIGNTVTIQAWIKADVLAATFVIGGLPFTASGRASVSITNAQLAESIGGLSLNTEIYSYGASTGTDDDIYIMAVYRV